MYIYVHTYTYTSIYIHAHILHKKQRPISSGLKLTRTFGGLFVCCEPPDLILIFSSKNKSNHLCVWREGGGGRELTGRRRHPHANAKKPPERERKDKVQEDTRAPVSCKKQNRNRTLSVISQVVGWVFYKKNPNWQKKNEIETTFVWFEIGF